MALSLNVPADLREQVQQFVRDWAVMSRVWLEQGAHDEEEIEYMRGVIREAMSSDAPPDPEADARPRAERIVAWCDTLATLRAEYEAIRPMPVGVVPVLSDEFETADADRRWNMEQRRRA